MEVLFFILVLLTAIVGFFSQEILRAIKRFFSLPGAILFFPLMFASLVAESYALWGHVGLFSFRTMLSHFEHQISVYLPFQTGALMLTRVVILVVIAMLPLWIAAFLTRKKPLSTAMYWAYCCSVAFWTASMILLITG